MKQPTDWDYLANALRDLRKQLRKASDELRETANAADLSRDISELRKTVYGTNRVEIESAVRLKQLKQYE